LHGVLFDVQNVSDAFNLGCTKQGGNSFEMLNSLPAMSQKIKDVWHT